MTLDPRRARLWDALQIGPRWQPRAVAADASAEPPLAACTAPLADHGSRSADHASRIDAIRRMDWQQLQQAVAGCTACALCNTRRQTVFGVGNPRAHWMLVGEAPGAEEDAKGEPFVGQAGRLLDNMLASIGLARSGDDERAVYIANVLKCRPPGNRNPDPQEVALCEPFLLRQVALVQPRLVLVMGRFAAQSLLGTDASIASLRDRVHSIAVQRRTIPVVVTYHPAYLLRNLADKSKSWADLCLARAVYARQAQR
jgi:DNA polymerase